MKNRKPTEEQTKAEEKTMEQENPQSAEETVTTDAELEKKLAEAEAKRDEYLDMAQRLQAEFDNYRRRTNATRSEAWEDGSRETIALMLPVLDNLERAMESAKGEEGSLKTGLELVLKQMYDVLEKRGVETIDRTGEPFDPELENAVMQADPSEGEPGTVCTVLQKGYKTKTRVIRHAMVRVVPAE